MKLRYHQGQNFGDALNEFVWESFLPDFFDGDDSVVFVGFGTLLGFEFPKQSRKVIFSTGGAIDEFGNYGTLNEIDETWDIKCVRGPLTAKALNLKENLAVTDGAVLVRNIIPRQSTKEYKVSYMPHVASLEFYNIEKLCDSLGIHFINPKSSYNSVIDDINRSELMICEAMHGAIVADALDVPWVPFKMFRHINEFKWNDWALSLEIENLSFIRSRELYNKEWVLKIINNKLPFKSKTFSKMIAFGYMVYQNVITKKSVKKSFSLAKTKGQLSSRKILEEKINILKRELELLKKEYS